MLTVKQPPSYGYKSVHDLPTPPSTSRPSPPLIYQEYSHKVLSSRIHRSHSPPSQSMSTPHRGLPPPAAMTLPPQHQPQQQQQQHQQLQQQQQQHQQPPPPPPVPVAPPPAHHAPPPPPPPHSLTQVHQPRDPWAPLPPPPPQQWQGAEDSMKNWLKARVEEDRRRQEEERTRQETLRLEQRKIEMDMLRTSISGGIPPVMIPLVFAGMGNNGLLPQAALDWAQQFMPPSQTHQLQILPAQPISPEHHREAQAHPAYASQPHPGAPPQSYGYPGSPTRPRGQTLPGSIGRPMVTMSHLPSLNTNVPQPQHPGASAMAPQPHLQQAQASQQESHASPSIYFHHWQPPTSQPSSSNRPASPSGDTPKKRKATGQPTASPTRGETRFRSPPTFGHGGLSTTARPRRGHTRQRSDMSSYRSSESGRSRRESFGGPLRGMSPIPSSALGSSQGPSRESGSSERSEPPKHSVSSMLSEEPRQSSQLSGPSYMGEGGEKRQRRTPPSDSRAYSGAPESSALHEVEGEG